MEIWKDVPGYEKKYLASSYGRIKSLNYRRQRIEKILIPNLDNHGYLKISLSINGKAKTFRIHKLISITFLNHVPCGCELVINHIDFNRQNNILSNLEIVTQKENTNQLHIKSSSKFRGVSWHKRQKKWCANIFINGKLKHIGVFTNEKDASIAFIKAEKELGKKIIY